MTGLAELTDEALVGVLGGFLENDRVSFLGRDEEMAIGLELLLGTVEPLLEAGRVKDRGDQSCRDLVRGRLSGVVGENRSDEAHGI